jgi:uncharacterized protein (TIGR03435 family)
MKRWALLLILAVTAMPVASQTAGQKLQFEVASVKANATGRPGLIDTPSTGRVDIVGATLKTLMKTAYRIQDYQIIGGPAWLDVDRFDVKANPPPDFHPQPFVPCFAADCSPTPVQIMISGLLADRFQLKVHRETRQLAGYELTIAKGGFKLKQVPAATAPGPGSAPPPLPPPPPPGTAPPATAAALPTPPRGVVMGFPFGLAASAVQFGTLPFLLEGILGRPVIDKTGIHGDYDFKLVFSRDGISNNGLTQSPPAPTDAVGGLNAADPRPSIFTALQEELGLKLESGRGPVQVLVIESVQHPSEN